MADEVDRAPRGRWVGTDHHFALRVYFEDTDAAGIVYYANYLKYMERARSDMLRTIGIDQRAALDAGEGVYVVAEAHISYRSPAHLDDELLLVSRLLEIRAASCRIHQRVMRDGEVLADGTIRAAFLKDGRPARQPADWVAKFAALVTKG